MTLSPQYFSKIFLVKLFYIIFSGSSFLISSFSKSSANHHRIGDMSIHKAYIYCFHKKSQLFKQVPCSSAHCSHFVSHANAEKQQSVYTAMEFETKNRKEYSSQFLPGEV